MYHLLTHLLTYSLVYLLIYSLTLLTCKLRNRAPTGGGGGGGGGGGESDGGEAWREGLDELSGGQNTLLNVR